MKKFLLFIIILVMAAIACSLGQEAHSEQASAYETCQMYVTRALVSPSTAEFPSLAEIEVRKLSRNIFRIHAHVDSQNQFGAMVRSVYVCDIQRIGEDSWNLIELEFPFDQN